MYYSLGEIAAILVVGLLSAAGILRARKLDPFAVIVAVSVAFLFIGCGIYMAVFAYY